MSTDAQIAANRANAQLSTGPKDEAAPLSEPKTPKMTESGKEAIAFNNLRHGLVGAFHLLPWENKEEFESLQLALRADHHPQGVTEQILVERMAQHEWLRQRALHLQTLCFNADGMIDESKQFSLYLRYQTTHERAFPQMPERSPKAKSRKEKGTKWL